MTSITIYDIEADKLENAADRNDTTVAEIVEMLTDYLEQMLEDNGMN